MELIDFYRDIEKIKHVQRKGWLKIGVSGVVDTIGGHSFGTALIGWVAAKREGFNQEKLIKMMLIHDLVMAHMADLTPNEKEYLNKREIENKCFEKVSAPSSIKEEFVSLFKEFQEEKSEEALLARECDKLETLFQAFIYSEKLNRDELTQFLNSYSSKIKSKVGLEILEYLKNKSF
jgi:putative hydrolases of HD superfamily